MSERRRLPRASTPLPIRILQSSFGELEAEIINLSGSGVYCEIRRLVPLMAKVQLTLLLPSYARSRAAHRIRCEGAVVRIEPTQFTADGAARFRTAIFFTRLSDADRDRIVSYVEHHLPTT